MMIHGDRRESIRRAMPQNSMTPLTANVTRSASDQLVTHWFGWLFVAEHASRQP
jgi:hypothetical protein